MKTYPQANTKDCLQGRSAIGDTNGTPELQQSNFRIKYPPLFTKKADSYYNETARDWKSYLRNSTNIMKNSTA